MKLEDFRIENYREREMLVRALMLTRDRYGVKDPVFSELINRLSRTECQEGGCEYCTGEEAQP